MNYYKLSLALWLFISLSGCKRAQSIPDFITLEKGETREVTYEDYCKDNVYNAEDVSLSLEEIMDLFDVMRWCEKSFLYFPITSKNLLQIMSEDKNRFLVEITNDSRAYIYHQKYASRQECREIILAMFERDTLDAEFLSDFYKVPIRTKTLDDVMKKELK
jgi:hypothetical protein